MFIYVQMSLSILYFSCIALPHVTSLCVFLLYNNLRVG